MKVFEYALPLLTVPYLVRTLGIGNFGLYSFIITFMSYFVVITNYGFNLTATRDISINRNNFKYVEKIISIVYIVKSFLAIVCFMILFLLVSFISQFQEDFSVYAIAFLIVIGNVLFPTWFFQGIEKMKYITFLNIFSRTIVTLMVFIFVNHEDDYVLALLIHSMSYVLPGIIGLFILKSKYKLKFTLVSVKDTTKMLNDGWHIFISSFLGNILASSGTFILGITSSNTVVGIYSSIEKIIRAIIGLFTPITQALFPFISSKFAKSYDEGVSIVKKLAKIVMLLSSTIGVIIMIFSSDILRIIYGRQIAEYSLVMQILVIWLLFSVLNNIIGYQYLIASKQEKMYSRSFLRASLITIALYLVLTGTFSIYGVIFAMLIGELSLTTFMLYSIIYRNKLSTNFYRGV